MSPLAGISDLTTTEGNLRNFSRICKIVQPRRSITRDQLVDMIRNYSPINRKNEKVIGRHLSISENLGILKKINGDFALSAEGEVLYEITKDINDYDKDLKPKERVFYFKALFSESTFAQLSLLLKALKENKTKPKNEVVAKYYRLVLQSGVQLWRKDSLIRRLKRYESQGVLQRPEENRFDCMRMWLEDLGLVENLTLSLTGSKMLSEIDPEGKILSDIFICYNAAKENIYNLSRLIVNGESRFDYFDFDNIKHREVFLKSFKDAFPKFQSPTTKLADVKSVGTWVSISLLVNDGLILEAQKFRYILETLFKDGVVESIIPADYARTVYIRIKANSL